MKKMLSLLLAVCLLFTLTMPALAAESGSKLEINPRFLTALDWTSAEWYEDDGSRAILACCAFIDVYLADDEYFTAVVSEAIQNDSVYVAQKSLSLAIFFYGDEDVILVTFRPYDDEVEAGCIVGIGCDYAASAMKGLKEDGVISSYYRVDAEDIMTVLEVLLSD